MNYRILVLFITAVLIVVTLFILLETGRKTSAEFKESTEPNVTEPSETIGETKAAIDVTEPTQETICEAIEAPTEPEPTEAVTVPEETVEVTEAPTEPPAPSEEVVTRSYYDVPLDHDLQDHIFYLCEMYDVDPKIVIAMIRKESTYNSQCIGDNGNSYGLMQIQPMWHQKRMNELGCVDLLNPYQNVQVGIDYLAEMLEWGGSIEWALMAYNAGPSYAWELEAEGRVSYYARTVLEYADELEYA